MADGAGLRPQDPQKGSLWLLEKLDQLPQETESQVRARAYRLTHPQYRAICLEMASDHLAVISILRSAANDSPRYHCLFIHAMKEMANFLENFATKVAPFSGSPLDPQFKILMENFGTVLDTVAVFYDRFGCNERAENLIFERNEGHMYFFRFDRNDLKPVLDREAGWRLYRERFPGNHPTNRGQAHRFYSPEGSPEPALGDANMVDVGFSGSSLGLQDLVNPSFQNGSFFLDAYHYPYSQGQEVLGYGPWTNIG